MVLPLPSSRMLSDTFGRHLTLISVKTDPGKARLGFSPIAIITKIPPWECLIVAYQCEIPPLTPLVWMSLHE